MSSRGNNKRRFGSNRHRRQNFSNGGPRNNERSCVKEFRHTEQLTEAEVGITEYISDLEGFSGVIKARYSDFQVNEIDLDGKVAILTNTDIPKEKTVDFEAVTESPVDLLPQDIYDKIREMIKNGSKEPAKFDVNELSKEDRTIIHQKIKGIFGSKIVASTVMEDEKKFVLFKKSSGHDTGRGRSWPEEWGSYVHFLVYKESLDTMNACYQIAEATRIKPSNFAYAGIKDKRGKTTQWFSAKQVEPWKLIIKTKPIKKLKIGNITFKDTPLKLGDLNGNKFRIVLRNVVAEDELIEKAVDYVKEHGFINYYGLQRFGNDKEVPTFTVGVSLLLGKWEEACKLILKPKPSDESDLDISKAKKIYFETGDPERAYKCFQRNRNSCVESKLLEGFVKEHKNAYLNALENIPRNMRLLYIHSFQSLIWNTMVSKRIKKYGLQPVENDLVVVNEVPVEPAVVNDEEEGNEEDLVGESKLGQQVKSLEKSDLENYTIFDIVMPLPGYDIQYPENMKEEYKEEIEKYGLTLEMPKQANKTYTLSGAYRKIIGRAQDLTWRVMRYNDPNESLILSDFDVLRKFETPVDIPDGKYKAVILELSLDSSSYATMVLREIMKIDTSPSAQAKITNYAGLNKFKKIAVTNENDEEKFETIDNNTSSLLNDQEKLKEFKNSIFVENTKRKNDDEVEGNKKLKTD